MVDILFFGIAMIVLVVLWFVGRIIQKRELQSTQKTISMKLKNGVQPEDIYPMW